MLAYKASLLRDRSTKTGEARALRARIPGSPTARALLRIFDQDEKTLHHVYRKWQGPHWTLACLALIDYPPGDPAVLPLAQRVSDWLFSRHFLESPLTVTYPGQENRVRHCASMDGNAIWYSVRLGLENERTRALELRQASPRHSVVVPGIAHPGTRPVDIWTRPRLPAGPGRRTPTLPPPIRCPAATATPTGARPVCGRATRWSVWPRWASCADARQGANDNHFPAADSSNDPLTRLILSS